MKWEIILVAFVIYPLIYRFIVNNLHSKMLEMYSSLGSTELTSIIGKFELHIAFIIEIFMPFILYYYKLAIITCNLSQE